MLIPKDLKYTKTHEWVKMEGDVLKIGITDYAQEELGEIVYIELPDTGSFFDQFASLGVIESIKSVSELYAPLTGKVISVNNEITTNPQLINTDPYGKGWIIEMQIDLDNNKGEFDDLLEAEEYKGQIGLTDN